MKINQLYSLVVAVMALFMAGCSPDQYSLGDKSITADDLVENIGFTITHDAANPNIVYLKSLLPSRYTVLWDHPQGRVQASEVTLKIPFAGTYTVRMGVETRGGVVYGPETTFTIDGFCADFVNDPLWEELTGGVGHSKKWFIDLDSKGVKRYFVGPLFFYGTDDCWESVTLGQALSGDSWSWAADWPGNNWQYYGEYDAGYMEFDLIDGAHVTVYDAYNDVTYTGPFMLDTENHTILLTDAPILHDPMNDPNVANWSNVKLLALADGHMQLGVIRTNDPCTLSFNYISEEYRDNWTPQVNDAPVYPELPEDWRDYVEPKTNKVMTFKLSDETPFDWCNLDGTNKNVSSFAPVNGVEDLIIEFNRNGNEYSVTTPEGDTYKGTYELNDEGIYTFSDALPVVQLSQSGNAHFKGNADNTLRIMSYVVDDYSGSIQDLWLGSQVLDDQGNLFQYIAYHFVLQTGSSDVKRYTANINFFDTGWSFINGDNVFITGNGDYTFTIYGSSDSPYGIYLDVLKILADYPNMDMSIKDIKVDGQSIDFSDADIDRGIGDAATTARRYILNPWGATANDAPKYVFSSSIEVKLHVVLDNGTPFVTSE